MSNNARATWNRALVTGASAGIGTALATELARRGVDLVLVARDAKRLEALADELRTGHRIAVEVLPADLADAGGLRVVEQRLHADPFIDLLVNNAGIGTFGVFAATDIEAEARTVAVNVVAPMRLARAALDQMHAYNRGTILTISSLDALQPTPNHCVYGASKAFVNSFFEALHEEHRKSPITITTVMPGYVHTEFTKRAGIKDSLAQVPDIMVLTPEQVAIESLDAALHGKLMAAPGNIYKAGAAVIRLTPRNIGRKFFGAIAPKH